ncbi:putative aldo/keto reductase [Mollisia scopiformis]|uniref:Putative aldo/keto reductase n=1 Tax=Mollisia scopiformis TaxID=149040 RepID=A0A132B721_MOLSC|nr:putative aldo/keto reductase [Mollisia scopiformis]KUJ08208.1 putative aldo/keto reductase [Mollisia scopiformis]
MPTPSKLHLLFGAGGIGSGRISRTWTTAEQTSSLLSLLQQLGIQQLDSGASYPPGSPWVTERLLGESKAVEKGFVVDTKVLYDLSEKGIERSVEKSLELLGVERVNILYSHSPDKEVPIGESAKGFDVQYRAGRFEELGLSNYSAAELKEWIEVCDEKGYIKPTVWQGHYNAIKRTPEENLFPFLREHGIRVIAYGPLAGGFLTGKVSLATEAATLSGGRWAPGLFPAYPETFDKPAIHNAMIEFCKKCEAAGMTPTEVSLRWIMNHSELRDGDAIILGATKVDQLRSNVELCRKGPLDAETLEACEELWRKVKGDMPDLF